MNTVLRLLVVVAALVCATFAEHIPDEKEMLKYQVEGNTTTGGPYTYSQKSHHFYGTAYDGSKIDTTGACAGANDSCRNNPSCQCTVSTFVTFNFLTSLIPVNLEKRRPAPSGYLHPRRHVYLQGIPEFIWYG
jgi:hypothetical protein